MGKHLALIVLAFISETAHADFWDNCTATNGGTIITANSYGNDKGGLCNDPNDTTLTNNCNGKRFCLSSKAMNLWSAFTWCEAIGGQLASFESMCPNTQPAVNSGGVCPNIKGIVQKVWTSTGWNGDRVIAMWSNGGIGDNYRNRSDLTVLCEEK